MARQPCTACRLHAKGLPRAAGWLLSHSPVARPAAQRVVGLSLLKRALAARAAHDRKRHFLAEIDHEVDRVVAASEWLAAALRRNGLRPARIVTCPQGVDLDATVPDRPRHPSGPLRVGFVGRYDWLKGLHVLVDAAARIPGLRPIEFHVWGTARTPDAKHYESRIRSRAAGDARFTFHGEMSSPADVYSRIDVLAVPSLCFETGPLVVLEAQAAGLPIVGSRIGGIAERVADGRNGILVSPGDAEALARAFVRLVRSPDDLACLRYTGPVRTMTVVAKETAAMYASIESRGRLASVARCQ